MMELHSFSDTCDLTPVNQVAESKPVQTTSHISPWLRILSYFLGRNFLLPLFFGHIQITGQRNIPLEGPVIIAPTHRSRWDALLVPYATGRGVTERDLRFMVTSDECHGLQGWFIRRLGGFSVDTKRPAVTSLRHAVDILRSGEMLVIFPEGGIRKGKLHPLKPGIARLALNAQSSHPDLGVKILPVSISYSDINPTWGTDVNIHIGEPIKVCDYTSGCVKKDAKRLTSDLTHSLQNLTHQELEIPTHTPFAEIPNS